MHEMTLNDGTDTLRHTIHPIISVTSISVGPDSREMSNHVLPAGFREHLVKQMLDYFRGPWPILAEAHAYNILVNPPLLHFSRLSSSCVLQFVCSKEHVIISSQIGELHNFMGQVQCRVSISLTV